MNALWSGLCVRHFMRPLIILAADETLRHVKMPTRFARHEPATPSTRADCCKASDLALTGHFALHFQVRLPLVWQLGNRSGHERGHVARLLDGIGLGGHSDEEIQPGNPRCRTVRPVQAPKCFLLIALTLG